MFANVSKQFVSFTFYFKILLRIPNSLYADWQYNFNRHCAKNCVHKTKRSDLVFVYGGRSYNAILFSRQ